MNVKQTAAFLTLALAGVLASLAALAAGSTIAARLLTPGMAATAAGLAGAFYSCLQAGGGRRWASATSRTAYLFAALALVGGSGATTSLATSSQPAVVQAATTIARLVPSAGDASVPDMSLDSQAVNMNGVDAGPVDGQPDASAPSAIGKEPASPAVDGLLPAASPISVNSKDQPAMQDMPGMSQTSSAPASTNPGTPGGRAPASQPDQTPSTSAMAMPATPAADIPTPAQATGIAAICDKMEDGPHMYMTPASAPTQADLARAASVVSTAQGLQSRYADVSAAMNDGFRYDGPNLGRFSDQMCYHFTSYANAFQAGASFDPTRPTSLLYVKPSGGAYQLVGVMYTAPLKDTVDQLNARVPSSVYPWHQHINVCNPPAGFHGPQFGPHALFGLQGSISTEGACAQAGGTFIPHLYSWMDHVFPFGH